MRYSKIIHVRISETLYQQLKINKVDVPHSVRELLHSLILNKTFVTQEKVQKKPISFIQALKKRRKQHFGGLK